MARLIPFPKIFRLPQMRLSEWLAVFCVLAVLLPMAGVFSSLFQPWSNNWQHITRYLLTDYIIGSAVLLVGVAIGTCVLGISLAWMVTMLNFPGRRVVEFMILLPLAIPTYVLAFVYRNLFDYVPWGGDIHLPALLSVIIIQSLSFYVYVYLFVRASLMEQSVCILEAGRLSGCSAWECFYRLAMPLSRMAIVAGVALALMECLNDFGSMSLYGLSTLTTGIYRLWNGIGDVTTAAQLASLMVIGVILLLGLERYARRKYNFSSTTNRRRNLPRYTCRGSSAVLVVAFCWISVIAASIIPFAMLCYWSIGVVDFDWMQNLALPLGNSMFIAAMTAIILMAICLVMAYGYRWHQSQWLQYFIRLSGVGYAMPGVVLALSLFIVLNFVETNFLSQVMDSDPQSYLTTGWFALILAYCIRFMNFGYSSVEVGLAKIPMAMDEAARMAGAGAFTVFRLIHYKLLQSGLFAGAILIFVEVIKELPATLLLRPFNFDTLAVKTYMLAADEKIYEASLPALAMVICGIIAVIFFNQFLYDNRNREDL